MAGQDGIVLSDFRPTDIAIMRLETPFYSIAEAKRNSRAGHFHFGDADFRRIELNDILAL